MQHFELHTVNMHVAICLPKSLAGGNPAVSTRHDAHDHTLHREIVEHVCGLAGPEPLGGAAANQQLAAEWVAKLDAWDGNLYLASHADAGVL
jgi:hypothetical protein